MCKITSIANSAFIKSIGGLVLLTAIYFTVIAKTNAFEAETKYFSVSQGQLSKTLNPQQRKNIIEANKLVTMSEQLSAKTTLITRAEILSAQKESLKKTENAFSLQAKPSLTPRQFYSADFAIYGASSFVLDDFDGDGFYQTFSVSFDADIYSYTENQFGEVYALMYVSKNGGPWTHYFTTDNFLIEGDTDADEYEVITTFLSGYSSDHYDILIDLYQEGYSDIVATYSADDSNALYGLPLESADYDEPYIEVVEVRGGSMHWLLLLIMSACFIRIKTRVS